MRPTETENETLSPLPPMNAHDNLSAPAPYLPANEPRWMQPAVDGVICAAIGHFALIVLLDLDCFRDAVFSDWPRTIGTLASAFIVLTALAAWFIEGVVRARLGWTTKKLVAVSLALFAVGAALQAIEAYGLSPWRAGILGGVPGFGLSLALSMRNRRPV